MKARIVASAGPRREAHRREKGFTLVELLVTTAIMAIVAGGIGGAFAIGSKVMSPGGVRDRLAGANDGMVLEQVLARDISRASCLQVAAAVASGSCSKGFASSAITNACSAVKPAPATVLCAAWPVISNPSDPSCHVAVYTQVTIAPPTVGLVNRTEYKVVYGTPTTVSTLQTTPMGTDPFLALTFTPTLTTDGTWVSTITVLDVTNAVVGATKNPPKETLVLRPLAADPSGPGTTAGIPREAQC